MQCYKKSLHFATLYYCSTIAKNSPYYNKYKNPRDLPSMLINYFFGLILSTAECGDLTSVYGCDVKLKRYIN